MTPPTSREETLRGIVWRLLRVALNRATLTVGTRGGKVPWSDADANIVADDYAKLLPEKLAASVPPRPDDALREALVEMVAAFTGKPDVDENDHPEGLTKQQVERAWNEWGLRQDRAVDAARFALASLPAPAPLDVERLARAMSVVAGRLGIKALVDDDAPAIAAEYARLAPEDAG